MKKFDIVVFGATSFVGNIMVQYLLNTYPAGSDITWAIAGRSEKKLKSVLEKHNAATSDIPIILCDAQNDSQIQAMCEQAEIIISTVGPYAIYGEPIVRICAARGVHYLDLTGEPQFIEKMLSRYEDVAKTTGAHILHTCGFDSLPSDLGVYYLQQLAKTKYNVPCEHIKMRVKRIKGSFSGGTAASMMNIIKEARYNPHVRRVMTDPYSLCPKQHGFTTRQHNHKSAEYEDEFNAWAAPFVMASINTKIVHRTNALLDKAYGEHFKYDEAMLTGKDNQGAFRAYATSTGLAVFTAAAAFSPSRWLLEQFVLPKSGEGPSPEEQENGFFDLRFLGKMPSSQSIRVKVTGDRDPGYGSTAKMLTETAVTLHKYLKEHDSHGGFWTPAALLGETLIERLSSHAGLSFEEIDSER
ncbi:saccharopine dehydrogenase NADP-binding domain-containing protein [Aestuariibacter sp. AA17]|uniref:Saccharopine dehydrogenase NADP-binding domain-containing protein n=1 Tax=Fluctibacter corallii TaxID=2984329 RepID=A0ABT3A8S6_9ALTE|nr:saccharopine dehydrogenase NADP-binding domain-containing protein [Aestuariibacter sp. AA17]MCV2885089.1 saccharopine dehydrogenase NADP-binding domain-containing protein [Aestuariibacter sp. AA17]